MAVLRDFAEDPSSGPSASARVLSAVWRRRDGFTFLELAVVVTIIGIMMAITAPRFTSTFSRATLGGAARRLAGTMAYLRNLAAKEGRGYFLNIDLDKDEYYVTYFDEETDLSETEYQDYEDVGANGEIYTRYSDDFVARTTRLERKIAFETIVLDDGSQVFDGTVTIEFRPDGTANETVIYLTNPKEKLYIVYLEGYNGQARVYKREDDLPPPPPELTEREPTRRRGDEL